MDSSPEMEQFGMSEADMAFSMDPGLRMGRRRGGSKKHQIYGMWASDSDSDDDTGLSGRAGLGGRKRKGGKYAGPISFVSGGIKQGGDPDKKKDDVDDVEILDEDEAPRPSKKKPNRRTKMTGDDSKGLGSWERHTRGIGMKLLEQMGYQHGKGLGKGGRGIVTPVEATKRAGKQAVGYYGSEKIPAPRKGDEPIPVEEEKGQPKAQQYKKTKGAGSSKPKYVYKTADEILTENSAPGGYQKKKGLFLKDSAMSKVKVIDMTGREQRVYSGYHHLTRSGQLDAEDEDLEQVGGPRDRMFDMPVLLHNLDLLLEDAEEGIVGMDRSRKTEDDRQFHLRHEVERLEKVCKAEATAIDRIRSSLELVTAFESRLSSLTEMPTEEAVQWIRRARNELGDMPELTAVVLGMARPLLAQALANWKPLKEPTHCLNLIGEWQVHLEDDPVAYDSLLEASWVPPLRRAIQSEWDPRNFEPLIQLLEAWKPYLSQFILNCLLLSQVIYHRLQAEVERWNPLTDTIPIHSWLHPWLPWLNDQMAPIHDLVRQKLGTCLAKWHPSDASAHAILLPWKPVFSPSDMTSFLRKHIIPKLNLVFQQMQINPGSQQLEPWNWVVAWADLLPPAMLADLLENIFFPRWLASLSQWLSQPGVSLPEVSQWYSGWRAQMPASVAEYPGVRDALQRALTVMESALSGLPPVLPDYGVPSRESVTQPRVVPSAYVPQTPKEMLEKRAQESGIFFHPIPSKLYEAKQVYRLGNVQIYLDRNVVFLLQGSIWQPMSINEVMSRAI